MLFRSPVILAPSCVPYVQRSVSHHPTHGRFSASPVVCHTPNQFKLTRNIALSRSVSSLASPTATLHRSSPGAPYLGGRAPRPRTCRAAATHTKARTDTVDEQCQWRRRAWIGSSHSSPSPAHVIVIHKQPSRSLSSLDPALLWRTYPVARVLQPSLLRPPGCARHRGVLTGAPAHPHMPPPARRRPLR